MKYLISLVVFLLCGYANAQFVSGQILTAQQLNTQFALYLPLSGGTITGPTTAAAFSVSSLTIGGSSVLPNLSATTTSIGGSSLTAGTCSTGTVSVSGATASMVVSVSPQTFPGAQYYWRGYVSSAGIVTVAVCAVTSGTPAASLYNVRVTQ